MMPVTVPEIAPGIFRLGLLQNTADELHCNGYLCLCGSADTDAKTPKNGAVVFDPGSVLDYAETAEQIRSVLGEEAGIRYVVLHHQDPDLCSAVPLLEKQFGPFEIAAHWRTMLLVRHYGIQSSFYIVNENDYRLSGAGDFRFIPAPYLHFPGAVMTYDEERKILFSGDLFGALSNEWTLYAGPGYMEAMKLFHEHYMPGNDFLRPVMETLLELDIRMICPQHGSVIRDNVREYIEVLRDLECGGMGLGEKKPISEAGGYTGLLNRIIQRYISLEGPDEVDEIFRDSPYTIDTRSGNLLDISPEADGDVLEEFFLSVYARGGSRWITIIEPYVRSQAHEYSFSVPSVFASSAEKVQMERELLIQENKRLQRINANLFNNLDRTSQEMTRCPVTGLYNEEFFLQYIRNILTSKKFQEIAVLFIEVEDLIEINRNYGEAEGDRVLKGVGAILDGFREGNHLIFRLSGPKFAYLYPQGSLHKVLEFAEELRLAVHRAQLFVEAVTVSVGVIRLSETVFLNQAVQEQINTLFSHGKLRLNTARKEGGDSVIYRAETHSDGEKLGRVCILEYDGFHAELLKEALEAVDIDVAVCMNGNDAVNMITSFHPDLIISEVYLPESNVFQVKETLDENTRLKDIPIVLVSFQKNEESVVQAQQQGITYFFKKPYLMPELIGLADILIKRKRFHAIR